MHITYMKMQSIITHMSGLPVVPLVCFSSYGAGDGGGGLL
jgi:hypothetical protein